jgi:predicted kinase
MEAVVLVGAQASGKTTFYGQRFARTHERISLDVLKTRSREKDAVARCLASGRPFVVDNTNVTPADRARYISEAKARGYRVIGYFFRSELSELLRRNNQREGREKVPPAGLVATFKKLQPPSRTEGFDELHVVRIGPGDVFAVESMPAAETVAGQAPADVDS